MRRRETERKRLANEISNLSYGSRDGTTIRSSRRTKMRVGSAKPVAGNARYISGRYQSLSIFHGAIAQNLRLERQAVAGPLRRGDDAVHHRHRVDPQIVRQAHILDPQPVRNRSEKLHVQFGKQMRRDRHAPGVGDGRDLAQFGQAAAHRIGLQDRQARILEEWF